MVRFNIAISAYLLAIGVQARLGAPAVRQITEATMPTETAPVAASNMSSPTELDIAIANFALNVSETCCSRQCEIADRC